jgi:hypothetical protein
MNKYLIQKLRPNNNLQTININKSDNNSVVISNKRKMNLLNLINRFDDSI